MQFRAYPGHEYRKSRTTNPASTDPLDPNYARAPNVNNNPGLIICSSPNGQLGIENHALADRSVGRLTGFSQIVGGKELLHNHR